MIAWAKANPGKLTVATNGEAVFLTSPSSICALWEGSASRHIPYKGSRRSLPT